LVETVAVKVLNDLASLSNKIKMITLIFLKQEWLCQHHKTNLFAIFKTTR